MNKKVLMLAPFMGLLLTSCSPWQSISYEKAKTFINEHYTIDGAKAKFPDNVHEKFVATATNDASSYMAFATAYEIFYNIMRIELQWTEKAPYKCTYEGDYKPGVDWGDPQLSPIVSEFTEEGGPSDMLIPSDKDVGRNVSYQVNGKKFKQSISGNSEALEFLKGNQSATYNDLGYRYKVSLKASANTKVTDPETGEEITIKFSLTYSGTYTYAE